MEESVLLGTKPLVDSKRRSIRDPSGVFPYDTLASVISLIDVTIRAFSPLWNENDFKVFRGNSTKGISRCCKEENKSS